MSISHLSYVVCNRCSTPAQPGDDAAEARAIARSEGFRRDPIDGDICPKCRGVRLITNGDGTRSWAPTPTTTQGLTKSALRRGPTPTQG